MSKFEASDPSSAIQEALKAKRDRNNGIAEDIAAIEASLLADIESFDLDAAERRAQREHSSNVAPGLPGDPGLVFPKIAPSAPAPAAARVAAPVKAPAQVTAPAATANAGSPLLKQLRQQAEVRQQAAQTAISQRTAVNEAIDQSLKRLFFFLHELVQQLNIVKPEVPRPYALIDQQVIGPTAWLEGFADYRSQSQSAGALVESVSCSYRLCGPGSLSIERDGPSVERFRGLLFDYGLQFTCKEFKNERLYVERAEFLIRNEISVSARWRADFANGTIILEARNLERLGSTSYTLAPQCIDQALLDDFGRVILGQPNRFRELIKRQ